MAARSRSTDRGSASADVTAPQLPTTYSQPPNWQAAAGNDNSASSAPGPQLWTSGRGAGSSKRSGRPSGCQHILVTTAITALAAILGITAFVFYNRPTTPQDLNPPPPPVAPGEDFHPLSESGIWLSDLYRNGATLREISGHIYGFNQAAGIYIQPDESEFVGYDLHTGEEKWRVNPGYCRAEVNGRILCSRTRERAVFELDYATGQTKELLSFPQGAKWFYRYLGSRDGVEFLIFEIESSYSIYAYKDGLELWNRPIADESRRCTLLYEKIGCAGENRLTVVDINDGEISFQDNVKFESVDWLNDGYVLYQGSSNPPPVFDLAGNQIDVSRDSRLRPRDARFAVADLARKDAELIDAQGRIVIRRHGYQKSFVNGKDAGNYSSWLAVSADGKTLAAYDADGSVLLDSEGNEIQRFTVSKYLILRCGLLTAAVDDKKYLLVPQP